MKKIKLKKIIFYSALVIFLFPTITKAVLIDNKITKTTYSGMEKISFKSDCTKYTTQTSFPKGDTSKTPGAPLEQNIYYNKNGSGNRTVIWFQHGDGGCSSAPRKKCESAYFDASQILTHSNNGKNFIMFCPEMNPSGGDACYKHWSEKYGDFFSCLYNDFLAAVAKSGDNLTVSQDTIFASHSQGGPATSKVTLNPPPNIKIIKIIRFDSCYGNQCLNEANIPVEKRGPLITYASTLPITCPADKFCNSTANQAATVAKEIYKKPNVESYLVKNASHGGVPTACKTAFLDTNHNCGGQADLVGGATTNIAGSGGTAVSSIIAPGGDVLGGVATFDEIKLILLKPHLQVRLPGANFSDIKEVDDNGTKFLFIPFLGEYLAAGYKYAIVIAGIFATAMILNAGFTLLMAAGSSEKVSYAKKRIGEALIGLLLAVGSYVFLYTINPELVNFRNLRVMAIRGIPLDNSANESVLPSDFVYPPGNYSSGTVFDMTGVGKTSTIIKDGNKIVYGFNNIPYYSQYDQQWAKLPFGPAGMPSCTCAILPNYKRCKGAPPDDPAGDDNNEFGKVCCTDIAHGGCNITSYAMVLRHLGKPVDPKIMAALAVESGARTCNGGITAKLENFHKAIEAKWPDIKVEGVKDHNKVIELLKQAKPIITRDTQVGYTSEGSTRQYKGHFMVYTGVDENQKIIFVNDPGNRDPKKGITHISFDQFLAKNIIFYYVHPK